MKKLIALFLFSLCTVCSAGEKEEAIAGALMIAGDWLTTRDMSHRYNEGYYETGPVVKALFGNKPSTTQVDVYFAARLLLHYALYNTDILSTNNKRIYYYITIADHGSALANNISIGLKLKF